MTDRLRAKAEAIAKDLMTYAGDRRVDRLLLVDRDGAYQGAWAFDEVVNRIYRHLLELEEERT